MANQKRVLILGGTGDAIELAAKATEIPGVEVITSLAGRTRQPVLPSKGRSENIRIGGFGGVAGLTDYLRQQQIDALIDATHPFASQISGNAAAAASAIGIPHLMLIRPAWDKREGDRWIEVDSHEAAAAILPELAQRIFLTVGRQELAAFAHLNVASLAARAKPLSAEKDNHLWFLMRMIEPPLPGSLIPSGKVLLERGPFSLEAERSRLQQYEIGAIVSKNSGGNATYTKVIAARELNIPMVMIQRPPMPAGEWVMDADLALLWLSRQLCP